MPPATPRYFQLAVASAASPEEEEEEEENSPTPLPRPRLRLHNNSLDDQGSLAFALAFADTRKLLKSAVGQVLMILYPSTFRSATHGPSSSSQTDSPWPEVRSITLVVDDGYDGVAYTTGIPLDDSHKEMHLSTNYVLHQRDSGRLKEEITGVVVHEMVHCWQHSCNAVPGGLIEGVADFVRLKANLGPPHWKKEHGDRWDAGYQHTAYFLDWLESKFGSGTVERLNLKIGQVRRAGGKYDEDQFWTGLFGQKVGSLWEEYGKSFDNLASSTP